MVSSATIIPSEVHFLTNLGMPMQSLDQQIKDLKKNFLSQLDKADSQDALEEIRITYLGRKGKIADLMDQLKNLPLEEKKEFGPQLNELKKFCEITFEEKKEHLNHHRLRQEQRKKEFFDVTASLPNMPQGSLHPLTQLQQEINDIFISMGFEIAQGPEVENERNNFEALNIAKDHPARDMWDTLWLDNTKNLLLRTHTSSVQIHQMEEKKAPLAIVAPGRCYRHEATDATHDFMFSQVEGLFVDHNVSLSNLLATMREFMRKLFAQKQLNMRVRPSYFPFVEPGIEIDIECPFCNHGCSVCKYTEWIEMCGAGLVHPNVLDFCGINHQEYSGFAFGFGLTRLAMLKYSIPDIRLLHANNVEFLKQF